MKMPTMHFARVAVLPLLLGAGCASVPSSAPIPQPEAVAPQSIAAPVAPATAVSTPAPSIAVAAPQVAGKATEPAAKAPPPAAVAKAPAAPGARAPTLAAPAVVASPAPAAAPALDLNALKEQLKDTKAIGIFTKITLKNQVDDLLDQFREYHQGKAKLTMTDLRRSYDLLMMKVLSLLQDEDQPLASAIVSSREAIWGLLADPKKFATLQG